MENKKKLMERLRKLLALANSSNPNEAAVAFRQAQKLMQAHALSDLDVNLIDVMRANSSIVMPSMPAAHVVSLTNLTDTAFGVRSLLAGRPGAVYFSFIGVGDAAEISCYVFDVLLRQLNNSRKRYIATLNKALKRSTKTRRADLYCRAWIARISETVQAFTLSQRDQALLESYFEHYFPNASSHTVAARRVHKRDTSAYLAGVKDAAGVSLNRGVKGSPSAARLEFRS